VRMSGEATELDRGLIEKITDPLTHLVRNAIDHGLETPDERVAAGKPRTGAITLAASQRGGNIVIEVSDDGAGLDRERIIARALERGIGDRRGRAGPAGLAGAVRIRFSTARTGHRRVGARRRPRRGPPQYPEPGRSVDLTSKAGAAPPSRSPCR